MRYFVYTTIVICWTVQAVTDCYKEVTAHTRSSRNRLFRPINIFSNEIYPWTSLVIVLVSHRLASSFNSTGQKWASLPDLNYYLQQLNCTWIVSLFSSMLTFWLLIRPRRIFYRTEFSMFFLALFTFTVKLLSETVNNETPSAKKLLLIIGGVKTVKMLQKVALILIPCNMCYRAYKFQKFPYKATILSSFFLLMLNLHRLKNFSIPFLIVLQIISWRELYRQSKISTRFRICTIIWFIEASFFYQVGFNVCQIYKITDPYDRMNNTFCRLCSYLILQGNSNGFASVDVNAGYYGFESFSNSFVIGLLIFLNTFSSPIFIILSCITLFSNDFNVCVSGSVSDRWV